MTSSETLATAEGRFRDVIEKGRTRLRAVVDDAERRMQARLPDLHEQLELWQERSFEDAERLGSYVTDRLSDLAARLPRVELPFPGPWPEPEVLVERWFDTTQRMLTLQRKLTLDWIAALRSDQARKTARDDPIPGAA